MERLTISLDPRANPRVASTPLKIDGSEELVFLVIFDPELPLSSHAFPNLPAELSWSEKIKFLEKLLSTEIPSLKFEVIPHELPQVVSDSRPYIQQWPQLGNLIHQIPDLFVFRRDAYQKLCTGVPLRYDEIYCPSREYVPFENLEPIYFYYIYPRADPNRTLLDWIRNGCLTIPAPALPPVLPVPRKISTISLVPEIFVHLHHPCANERCQKAPAIILETLGSHFEIKTHLASRDLGCLELPTLDARFYSSYPVLAAMSKKTYQKLLEKQEVDFDEVETFAAIPRANGQRTSIQTDASIEWSKANILKWLKLEKANLP